MADNTLKATVRSEFGKGAARRARREGMIPAVLYGHGTDPVHLSLPYHDTYLLVRASRNAVVELEFDGNEQMALVKDVQINHILREIEHLDLVIVKKGETVLVHVPVVTEGEPFDGAIAAVEQMELPVSAPAISIPESIVVTIDGLPEGTVIRVSDLELPEGVTTELDPEAPIVLISAAPREEELEATESEEATEEVAEEASEESAE